MINEQSLSKGKTKKGWLDYLYYKEGKQQTDFFVCGTYGDKKFTKWKTYLNAVAIIDMNPKNNDWKGQEFFNKINQRQILPHEIVLDIEDPGQLRPIVEKIDSWNLELDYFVFETGSRGFHIHIFLDRAMTTEEKESIVLNLDTDIQKCSEKNLIALEYHPHWKTGKLKQEVVI